MSWGVSRNKLIVVWLLLLPLLGCNQTASRNLDQATDQFAMLGRMYGEYLAKHNGAPPSDEAQLTQFLETKSAQLSRLQLASVADLLRSPRDNQPLVVMYEKGSLVEGPGGLPWVAHERTGVDGKRYAIGARGSVEAMTDEQIKQTFL